MKVKFWGVRGSIPSPLTPNEYKNKIKEILSHASKCDISNEHKIDEFISELPGHLQRTYGGNTSCVTITTEQISIILDAGSGLRLLGKEIVEGEFINPTSKEYHLFLSHLHWDHINGLPFFAPLHIGNSAMNIYSVHDDYEKILSDQQNSAFFPVSLESRPVEKKFHKLKEGKEILLGGLKIVTMKLDHPNGSYAFKVTDMIGTTIVYATDGEYKTQSDTNLFVEFYKNADILIFDSQYSSEELRGKLGFGHSSYEIGIDLAIRSNVKKIVLFHHNHEFNDQTIEKNLFKARTYLEVNYPESNLVIVNANENLEFNI
ncbi:MAG: MBL fold metallo-hydrolase [Candidatus Delongbacteria bacterium]|nr:MBL fold metallo-hydrolase [Candidatus Delongbacteria bacterium]